MDLSRWVSRSLGNWPVPVPYQPPRQPWLQFDTLRRSLGLEFLLGGFKQLTDGLGSGAGAFVNQTSFTAGLLCCRERFSCRIDTCRCIAGFGLNLSHGQSKHSAR